MVYLQGSEDSGSTAQTFLFHASLVLPIHSYLRCILFARLTPVRLLRSAGRWAGFCGVNMRETDLAPALKELTDTT